MNVVDFLHTVPIFQGLSSESKERLAQETLEEQFPAGERIVRRGTPGDRMYLLVDGKVQVPVLDPDGDQVYVAQLGPRQIFGEMALLTGDARRADVIAAIDCRCLVFPRDAVDRLVRRQPDVAQLLTAILGERLVSSRTITEVGKYKLVREMGRGGTAIVYEGIHPTLERPVAVKMLLHRVAHRPRFRERFQNEARIISRLRHPNIVEVYDTEEAYATFFIITEKFAGEPLDVLLASGHRLSYAQTRDVLRQVASALAFAHRQGIVHRDIRPSNIVLNPEGTVKLTDFGLALDVAAGSPAGDETSESGSPAYMAPEQIADEPVDRRSDIYSLGIVGYELLTGSPPWRGQRYEILGLQQTASVPSPRRSDPEVPDDLEQFVRRATARSPEERYPGCEEVVELLMPLEETATDIQKLRIATLTFVYDQAQESSVARFLDDVRRRAEAVQGLEVR